MRRNTIANARGLLGAGASKRECRRIARGMVASFHDFIFDLARLSQMTPQLARSRVRSIEHPERYQQARDAGRGVILVTAHLGSFELALSALAEIEERLHVVFKRDEIVLFERARKDFRELLGVHECSIDGGLAMWAQLGEALGRGETVLMQGDRVMEGQRGAPVRFGAGRILVPAGPAKLARLSGATIVPTASLRDPDGSIRILNGVPIDPPQSPEEDSMVLQQIADALSEFVLRCPEQWITPHRVYLDEESMAHRPAKELASR